MRVNEKIRAPSSVKTEREEEFPRSVPDPQQDADRRAQRRDLCEREVHENHAARNHVQAQIRMDHEDHKRRGDRRDDQV